MTKTNVDPLRLLLVDDESSITGLLDKFSAKMGGVRTAVFTNPADALDWAGANNFDVALVDYRMPGLNGLDLVAGMRRKNPGAVYMVMSGHGDISIFIGAIRAGIFDFLRKPVEYEDFSAAMARAREHINLKRENLFLRSLVREGRHIHQMLGLSKAMEEVRKKIALFAQTDSPVLITGETGVGKEIAARLIHAGGPRARQPFVAVNCGAFPETLVESELFGHEKGSFTGADFQTKGKFERAGEGTLLLDEIAELAPHSQTKLLRVLQERIFDRVGGSTPISFSARIICATNRQVEELISSGKFREDLYYRINTLRLRIPPLRERKEDIHVLAERFREKFNVIHDKSAVALSPAFLAALMAMDWPGNVRQLENVMDYAVLNCQGDTLLPEHLPEETPVETQVETATPLPPSGPFAEPGLAGAKKAAMDAERELLMKTLKKCRWNKSAAAKELGITRGQLGYKLKKLSIE